MEEIKRKGNVFSCEFNGMQIRWAIGEDCSDMNGNAEEKLKQCLQTAIGLSGKMWQVAFVLNKSLPFPSKLYVNGKEVEYPKN